jgi:MFS family permease
VAAGVEAVVTRALGRVSDRAGRIMPIKAGLAGSAVAALLLPLPDTVIPLALAVIAGVVALAFFWAPAMAMLSDAAEATGLDQGFAFALTNLAWAGGQVLGGSGSGAIAEVGSDAIPFLVVAALSGITLAALTVAVRRRAQPSSATVT